MTAPGRERAPGVRRPGAPHAFGIAASRTQKPTIPLPHGSRNLEELEAGPVAILGREVVVWGGGRDNELLRAPENLRELGELSERANISQFWVHESALESLGFPRALHTSNPTEALPHPFFANPGTWVSSRPGLCAWSYWFERGARGFSLQVPAYAPESPFSGLRTAADLWLEVLRYENATQGTMPWRGSGQITSDGYLRDRLRRTSAWGPTECPPPIEEHLAQELAYTWHRTPRERDANYRYLHALDLNLAYAAPACALELPQGAAEFRDWPTYDPRLPGLYLFEVTEPWPYVTPPPWGSSSAAAGSVPAAERTGLLWVTGPTAERMTQCGYEPIEGWVWPRHGRYLRPWYELLRNAREELLEGGGAALSAVKGVCRQGVGRLASERRTLPRGAEYLEDDPMFQPYWSWAVIAELRCRIQRRLSALEVYPVAVDTDALYFLSSRRSPAELGARVGLPLGDGLGKFKPAGSCRASDALEALSVRDSAAAVGRLRRLVREGLE